MHTPEPTRPPPPPPPQVHAFACGQNHSVLSADDSVIAWGHGTASGELGFGAGAKKSAARAEKVETLEKLQVAQVACGYAHTVLLADGDSDVVKRLPAWTPAPAKEAEAGPSGEKGGPPKKKAKKCSQKGASLTNSNSRRRSPLTNVTRKPRIGSYDGESAPVRALLLPNRLPAAAARSPRRASDPTRTQPIGPCARCSNGRARGGRSSPSRGDARGAGRSRHGVNRRPARG